MAPRRLGFWQTLAAWIVIPTMHVWTRPTWRGAEHLPKDRGFILVVNHSSHFDPLPVADFVYCNGVWPRFLGKASIFRIPVVGAWLKEIKQVPVERGTLDAARSVEVLVAAVREGGAVVVYPEGTTTRQPDLWPMRGKTGAARIALITGAPVIPVAQWGAHRVFDPRDGKFRFGLRMPVTVVAGPPLNLSRWAGVEPTRAVLDEITDTMMLAIRDLLAEIRGGTPPPLWQYSAAPRGGRAGAASEPAPSAGEREGQA
ncbi:lysophospholipid acyltransferase family protein [Catenuloplanes atrovinosus]|uniref:1-acyl-sn-glycerol-3-phosphate acyltransferase n=1 Tax=Catenuloplanes atrovinosus TaxID=137266 RepID=A0AAE4C6X8_9ACTN|nr:lysophospholipid acyltransferase family protein [Catenuloplanes atrovinosus]MDR7273268.1 1-acyl-sn-glycerol-3-phosphate acyltransferase [Catenuloplanes atrovinosus]